MEILALSNVPCNGESNGPQMSTGTNFMCNGESTEHEKQVQASDVTNEVDNILQNERDKPGEDPRVLSEVPNSESICAQTSNCKNTVEEQESPCSLNAKKQVNESCSVVDIPFNVDKCGGELPTSTKDGESHLQEDQWLDQKETPAKQVGESCTEVDIPFNVENIGGKLPSSTRDGESQLQEAQWLDQEETVALWVKWRGKWQAGIRCARADCPLSTLKARPTHGRKQYFVVFFPQTRNYSWADTLLVRPIHELPEPIAHKSHSRGMAKFKDLSLPRRFIIQKLAISMVNVSDQLHNEAVIESARSVAAWKEFALEASGCKSYSDLGRMLLKLQTMVLKQFIDPNWLQNSFDLWVERCRNAQSAEFVETLKEELINSVTWDKIEALWNAPTQPELGPEWKTWKQEVMKWFSLSNPTASEKRKEQPQCDSPMSMDHQISKKRPKLEVRRAEIHASQMEASTSHDVILQKTVIDIDSGYFNSDVLGNASTLLSDRSSDMMVAKPSAQSNDPPTIPDGWDKMVVEVENSGLVKTAEVAEPLNYMNPLDPGNKYRQCMAFIEAKGRQCVRWANEDSVYCCVHLTTRSIGKTANAEQAHPSDTPMCEGTTTHGTKCKHRSRFGSPFCKKHGLQENQLLTDMEHQSNSPENTLKRKHIEMSVSGKEMVLWAEGHNSVPENSISLMEGETFDGRTNSVGISGYPQCIGLYNEHSNAPCPERAKLHTLYCEKHLPSWLKRARNGKSRIISKEIFADLLRACSTQNQKLHFHQACELLYVFVKTILHRRNPVSKETQLQWILSEASKDIGVGEWLIRLVSREREKINTFWSFDVNKDNTVTSSGFEPAALVAVVPQSDINNSQNSVKCKICSEAFSNAQVLGTHWMENHKKEAKWLFRGYVCAVCMNSFTNKKVLEAHVRERHEKQSLEHCIRFQCTPCGTHFMSPQQLWSHVLTLHCDDFKLPSTTDQQHNISITPQQLQLGKAGRSGNEVAGKRFSCKVCGLKFDLLPDLGRHHQAAHMVLEVTNNTSSKRGTHLNPCKLKSGRPNHTGFTKGLEEDSYRIRKPFQASSSGSTGVRVQTQVAEEVGLGRLVEYQCSSVANNLFSEIQKTKPRPSNLDILSVARTTCCKRNLVAALEERFGILPERLYLKAAKLCSELNIQVEWHQEGYICPKGCMMNTKPCNSSPLSPLSSDFTKIQLVKTDDPINEDEWDMDECHCVLESRHIKLKPMSVLLFEDVSFGRETIPISCVVDENLLASLHNAASEVSNGKTIRSPSPWEGFTYVKEQLLDPCLGHDTKSSQLGCSCPHSTCSADACDHVYLFDNDYEAAEDINGQPMHDRFPYDEDGRIILKEIYPVYECNSMCGCGKSCRNRILQNGVKVKLEVFKTEKKGWAVRAGEAISRGTFVCEYIGEVLNDQEATKRYDKEGCSYLYHINSHIDSMSELVEGETVSHVIDATRYGNVSRFINHSCSPNLVTYQVLVDNMDSQLAHIGLYANRDIDKNEELAYDYRRELLLEGKGHPCYCGATNCRGRIY
ncbi:hypothetical protein C5167_014003 [Papaver somniferum]|uniref:Histone-lysine N-methyltransferase SUVR5 n=1 Tax=Papaver somniferum TaxID=3469 RepID=A0A4Y7J2W0_PAPSO|nr:histone-lysine N-methyltransferase SUVR5-like [Papaver somniferum]XP_026456170.1 histone-lysine N-methyltransferase SUVR5-like [Papaver somniferum]XP_026456171.1 histone-lysine N-methyltransferase SUVR5-like [Papaver somniferum]XP_026456172.1 histone-lysine N-methyltransferase SUVR5-like [Papaver somniferum]XP_026456173.1 histone-lysine N-methyltransferase SUVR5-like [Papaver somniferum]RZC55147.1 hypothetical protein C5167_014003 [Papaver somniferum]